MQAIKEKLNDMSHMRKAKAEAKEEENQEKEMAKTRVQVAKEVRMAREAEAAMDLHVNKAAEKIVHQETKYIQNLNADQLTGDLHQNPYGRGVCDGDYSTRSTYGNQNIMQDSYDHDTGNFSSNANLETSYPTNRTGVPPNTNKLL